MATAARVSATSSYQQAPQRGSYARWLWGFLVSELTPYPGRISVVARMVISATLVMIAIMTFHIPGAALGAYYTLNIPRDSPRSSLKAASISVAAFAAGTVYVIFGVMLFVDSPVTHFLWVVGSLFVVFYVLSVTSVYNAAIGFGFLVSIAIPLWERSGSTNLKVSGTLFTFLAVAVGCVIAVAVEYVAAAFTDSGDRILAGVADRLSTVERLLHCYEQERQPERRTIARLEQYATIGTGALRQLLGQARYEQGYLGQLGAVVALTGRLTDLAAVMTEARHVPSAEDLQRVRELRVRLQKMRRSLLKQEVPQVLSVEPMRPASAAMPLLSEMERCVVLISQGFAGDPLDVHLPGAGEGKAAPLFARDAFKNPAHVKFAIRGCLASSACYIFYTAVDWPGINTSVATCILTAFTTIGASRQKQLLRVSGALVGGVVFGLGAQIFVLPNLDSITGFMLLFAFVTTVSAWITTSSPRLAYAGLQVALAYYLINLNEFAFRISLGAARDRVVGVFVGLIAMWLIFDQLGAKPSAESMKNVFLENLHKIAAFGISSDHAVFERLSKKHLNALWAERNVINKNFANVRAQADAVLFEFRDSRTDDLAARQHVRAWQPELRTIFLIKLALLQDRLRDGTLPPLVEEAAAHASALLSETVLYLLGDPADAMESYAANTRQLLAELEAQQSRSDIAINSGQEGSPLQLARSLLLLVQSFVRNIREENVPLAQTRRRRAALGTPSTLPSMGRTS